MTLEDRLKFEERFDSLLRDYPEIEVGFTNFRNFRVVELSIPLYQK